VVSSSEEAEEPRSNLPPIKSQIRICITVQVRCNIIIISWADSIDWSMHYTENRNLSQCMLFKSFAEKKGSTQTGFRDILAVAFLYKSAVGILLGAYHELTLIAWGLLQINACKLDIYYLSSSSNQGDLYCLAKHCRQITHGD